MRDEKMLILSSDWIIILAYTKQNFHVLQQNANFKINMLCNAVEPKIFLDTKNRFRMEDNLACLMVV